VHGVESRDVCENIRPKVSKVAVRASVAAEAVAATRSSGGGGSGGYDSDSGSSGGSGQGCHTGRPEAFWRANRAGGPVHYALYEPGGVL
jgi:hypothetical protein